MNFNQLNELDNELSPAFHKPRKYFKLIKQILNVHLLLTQSHPNKFAFPYWMGILKVEFNYYFVSLYS